MGRTRQMCTRLLVIIGLLAFVATTTVYYIDEKLRYEPRISSRAAVTEKKPLPGHWLRTVPDPEKPGSDGSDKEKNSDKENRALREDVSFRHLNKALNAINILYIWTDKANLKVVSIMTLNKTSRRPALVVIPLGTVLGENGETLQDIYAAEGKVGMIKRLENRLETEIDNYVHINNEALYEISDILGPLQLGNERIAMAKVLEESAKGLRPNDERIVRAVAKQAIKPTTLVKFPAIVKVFKQHVESDISVQQVLQLLQYTRQMDINNMRKQALPGREICSEGKRRQLVAADTWQNILYDLTNQ